MKCTSKGWVLRKWALQGAGEVGCAELVMCWHEGFPHSCLSVHICACSRGTSFTSACCSSELSFQFSSLPIKHQLNRFWTKFQFCWKRLKSIEEENRRPWLKLFFILEWIIVLEGTSQWLIQQEETAFHYQLKGVSPLHLKQLISAAVRETSGIAQCGSSYPEKQTYPALYRKAEVCSCLQWQVDYVVCKQLYFMVLGKM